MANVKRGFVRLGAVVAGILALGTAVILVLDAQGYTTSIDQAQQRLERAREADDPLLAAIRDPDFAALDPESKRVALGRIDQEFLQLPVSDVEIVIEQLRERSLEVDPVEAERILQIRSASQETAWRRVAWVPPSVFGGFFIAWLVTIHTLSWILAGFRSSS